MWKATCQCGEIVICRKSFIGEAPYLDFQYQGQHWTRVWPGRMNPTYAVSCHANLRSWNLVFEEYTPPPLKFANCTLGCDPEFAGILDGRRVNFETLLRHEGALGFDHGGRIAEVRPEPGLNARTVVRHIRNILASASGEVRVGKWKAGAVAPNPEDALGGHVHIGIGIRTEEEDKKIVKALDAFSATLYALDILPAPENKIRQKLGYGASSNIRHCWHKGTNCLEYRTMCSWLYDPKVALIAMAGAKIAAVNPDFTINLLDPKTVSRRILHSYFERFATKQRDARLISERILDDRLVAQPDRDVQEAWELPDKPPAVREVTFLGPNQAQNVPNLAPNVPVQEALAPLLRRFDADGLVVWG